MTLNDKIKLIISERNLTPSHFADEIGVQRSSISHIMSGRNRPSLEIVQKIVHRFPDLKYEWLLEESEINTNPSLPLLTHNTQPNRPEIPSPKLSDSFKKKIPDTKSQFTNPELSQFIPNDIRAIEKILIFYSDKTFIEYKPV